MHVNDRWMFPIDPKIVIFDAPGGLSCQHFGRLPKSWHCIAAKFGRDPTNPFRSFKLGLSENRRCPFSNADCKLSCERFGALWCMS